VPCHHPAIDAGAASATVIDAHTRRPDKKTTMRNGLSFSQIRWSCFGKNSYLSGERKDLFQAEAAGNDGNRHREGARVLTADQRGDEWART
jgi:hypothetical protein